MGWIAPGEYQFDNITYVEVAANASVNFTDSLTLGFFVQNCGDAEDLATKVVTSGDPRNPADAQYFVESLVGGYLRIWLHTTTKSLVLDTVDPVLKTRRIIFVVVRWNNVTKTPTIFIDDVPKSYTINTFGNPALFHSAASSVTNLTDLPAAKVYFFYAFNTNSAFGGLVKGPVFAYGTALPNSLTTSLYQTYKPAEIDQPVETQRLLFVSNRVASPAFAIMRMNEEGKEIQVMATGSDIKEWPEYSQDYTKVTYINNGYAQAVLADADLGNPILIDKPGVQYQARYAILNHDNTEMAICYDHSNTDTDEIWRHPIVAGVPAAPPVLFRPAAPNNASQMWGGDYNNTSSYFVYLQSYSSGGGNDIYELRSYHFGSGTETLINFWVAPYYNTISAPDAYSGPRFSPNGQKIGFTVYVGGLRQVAVCDGPVGGNYSVITSGPDEHIFNDFDPTSTQVALTKLVGGVGQIYTCDLSGGNFQNISNNVHNDQHASWGNIV